MRSVVRSTILGAGIGAGLMFLLDPARGARRRAMAADKMRRAARKSSDAYDATGRDLGNRLAGVAAEVQANMRHEMADDTKIEARVRSALGRVASHPRAIRVIAANGSVMLTGDALASEVAAIERAVRKIRGVWDVTNHLTPHRSVDGVPALHGVPARRGWRSTLTAGSWSPTARMMIGVGAMSSLAAMAALRRA